MTDAGSGLPDPAPLQARRRAPRWLLAALFASLALNLLVVGSVAGAMWRFRKPPPWAGSITPNLLGYASTLAPERRKHLWALTSEERNHLRPFRREVRAARDETVKVLAAEPFDAAAFKAAQQHQAEAENRARQAVQDLYFKIAAGLTAEERSAFPHWREHRRPPGANLLDEPDHQSKN